VMSVTISANKRCSGSSLPPAVCRMAYVVFTYLCLLAYSGVQHTLCFSFAFLRLVSRTLNVASFSGMSFLRTSFVSGNSNGHHDMELRAKDR
jgi:hypothetical protein